MADFSDIGALLGLPAGNEMAYQKGLALGANTQNALAEARKRVRENTAMEQLTGLADELGLTPGLITAAQAGLNPQQITGAAGELQERRFRDIAGSADASVDAGTRNRALYGVASGPVKPLEAVGSKGYQDILHPEKGVMPLPGGVVDGGGDAAAIQVLRAFGFLDENGRVRPGSERKAFDVMRTTGKTVDEGGVPGVIDFNPFAAALPPPPAGGAAPAAAPDVAASLGTDLVPPAPAATPATSPTAAVSAAAAPPVAGTGAVTPASPTSRVASNVAEIERAKILGRETGQALADLPQMRARMSGSIQKADSVMADIDIALEENSPWVSGPIGKTLGFIWGTPAYDFKARTQRILNSEGFRGLQQMRYESPTGGALGQVAVQELDMLQNQTANLDTAQSPSQLAEMLSNMREQYERFKEAASRDYAAAANKAGGGMMPGADAAPVVPASTTSAAPMSLDDYLKSKGY